MKKFIVGAICFLFLAHASLVLAQNTYQSDYQYQSDQYRRNYAEYQVFKKDYLDKESLNNEQKAILSAKQTIIARELALANYYLMFADDISAYGVDYPLVNQTIAGLKDLSHFHFEQADAGSKIVSKADLSQFTNNYLAKVAPQKSLITKSQVAAKLAYLIKEQLELKRAYDALLPLLESKKSLANVQSGLAQVESLSIDVNDAINNLATKVQDTNLEEGSTSNFYTISSEQLAHIRDLQSDLVEVIIELDANYVTH